jgi:hypothetical protein
MNDNPSSDDLVKNGYLDYQNLILITNSYENLKKFLDYYAIYMNSITVNVNNPKFVVCNFLSKSSPDEFNKVIKSNPKMYGEKMKVFYSETPVITLNEVLDKINLSGRSSLNIRESAFLNAIDIYNK